MVDRRASTTPCSGSAANHAAQDARNRVPAPIANNGPLSGCRILDLSTVMMGPFATQLLAELGADVVKVEPPGGDSMRAVGPMRSDGMGPLYLNANRNKRSIVVDLKPRDGRDILLRLARDADVFVFNIRPQAMHRLGLGYDALATVNPQIIYVGACGFGSDGPYAGRPAYDDLIQGLAAIPSVLKAAGSDVPRFAPTVIADRVTGLSVANCILAALYHRDRTGKGQSIEVPMFETMVQVVLGDHLGGRTFDPPLGEMGYARLLAQHRRPYATQDGYLCAVVYTDQHWRSFFGLIGELEAFEKDPRFADIGQRTKHIDVLYGIVADHLGRRTTAQWLEALREADIPAMPLHTLETLLHDPHLSAVGFFQTVEHPTEGRLVQMRLPSRWSTAQRKIHIHAPRVGEHTVDVLEEAGFAPEQIRSWQAAGIIAGVGPEQSPHGDVSMGRSK